VAAREAGRQRHGSDPENRNGEKRSDGRIRWGNDALGKANLGKNGPVRRGGKKKKITIRGLDEFDTPIKNGPKKIQPSVKK